jgi:hypothetical protein
MPEPALPPPPPSPHTPTKAPIYRRPLWIVTGAAVAAVAVFGALSAPADDETPAPAARQTQGASAADSPTPQQTAQPSPLAEPVTITVPDVVGLPLRKARVAIQEAVDAAGGDATLRLEVVTEYSSEAGGTVLDSTPAGIELESGGTIRLTVAEPLPTVPNVVGLMADRATRELEDLGFTVRTRQQVSESESRGTVLSQSVAPGEQVDPGEGAVVLTLAKPPQGWFVRVEGSGSALVTWGNIGGTSQQTVTLPWSVHVDVDGGFDVVTIVAQRNSGSSGSITCEVIHSGRVVERNVSSGPYAVCTASASV